MIYTDGKHVISDTSTVELHQFMKSLGWHREWYVDEARRPHYVVTTESALERVLAAGGVLTSTRSLVKRLQAKSERYRNGLAKV